MTSNVAWSVCMNKKIVCDFAVKQNHSTHPISEQEAAVEHLVEHGAAVNATDSNRIYVLIQILRHALWFQGSST